MPTDDANDILSWLRQHPDASQETRDRVVAEGLDEQQERELREMRRALQSDSTPPGPIPDKPVGQAMMDAFFEARGGRSRPSSGTDVKAMNAGFSTLFERAAQGDEQAVFKKADEAWHSATERWRRSHR